MVDKARFDKPGIAKPSRPRELYRDPAHGKIAGICAGIGRYFDWPVWPIRLLLVLLAVFTQLFPLVAAYLIAWFILDPVSPHQASGLRGQVDDWVMHTRSRWDQRPVVPVEPELESQLEPTPSPHKPDAPQPNGPWEAAAHLAPAYRRSSILADPDCLEAAFAELEQQVRAMERHVTEPAFVLRQKFRSL